MSYPLGLRNLGYMNVSGFSSTVTLTGPYGALYGNITVANPAGADVMVWLGASGYANVASAILDIYLQVDGDGLWPNRHVGQYFFNTTSEHRFAGTYTYKLGGVAQGTHSLGLVLDVRNQDVYQDGANDWNVLAALEMRNPF